MKYCRLVRRYIGTNRDCRYYVQLVMDGPAPFKSNVRENSVQGNLAEPDTMGGLDIGPSKLAWVTEHTAGIFNFCEQVNNPAQKIERLQRRLSRQLRANNPDNFKADVLKRQGNKTVVALGTVIKGRKQWKQSVAQQKTQHMIAALHAQATKCRANSHGADINDLLRVSRTWRHDNVSVLSLQKNYGRSVSIRAPGRFMSELKRKAERACGDTIAVNVRQLKTSQYDHSTQTYTKKSLSVRVHIFGDGRGKVDRDIYSAFLAKNAVRSTARVDGNVVERWSHDPEVLEVAWQLLAPSLREKQLFVPRDGVMSTSTHRPRTRLGANPCQPINCKPVWHRCRRAAPLQKGTLDGSPTGGTSSPWSSLRQKFSAWSE